MGPFPHREDQVPATVAACAALRAPGQIRASQAGPPIGAERAALVVAASAAARVRRCAGAAGRVPAASVAGRPAVVAELTAGPRGADAPAVLAAGVRSTAATASAEAPTAAEVGRELQMPQNRRSLHIRPS